MPEQDSQSLPPVVALRSEELAKGDGPAGSIFPAWLKWAILFAPVSYLWFRLIDNLRLEWTTNPQYSYGSVVPFLCLGLLLRRAVAFKEARGQRSEVSSQKAESRNQFQLSAFRISAFEGSASVPWLFIALFAMLAFLYLPTRLIEEATPEWRPMEWVLGFEVIGLTLCAIYLRKGPGWLRQMAFPVCFFLVAIPWPTPIEAPVIQSLTRVNSSITVEFLGWIGIPAIQHGNLIEVGSGTVGVSEACSGIRSFQTSLMISLFFGEFYRMKLARRLWLVPAGFFLAMAFNVCRMSFLTTVAAKKGIAAIAQYHDPAGIAITLVCTAGLWGVALLFKEKHGTEVRGQRSEVSTPPRSLAREMGSPVSLALALLAWLVAVEVGATLWYRHVESHLAPSPKWSVMFPTENPTFNTLPMNADTVNLLRFDDGKQGAWIDPDGSRWQAFYFNWLPGRVAGYLAKRHTPEICLTASGLKMVLGPELTMMNINGVSLPVRSYVFDSENGPMYVFHCRWEAGANAEAYVTHESGRFNLIRGVWAGRGNKGQKVLEIIASGYADAEQAKAALVRQLKTLIKIDTLPSDR